MSLLKSGNQGRGRKEDMDEMLNEIEQHVRSCVDKRVGLPAVEIIGSKWLMRILFHLCRRSPRRFGELQRRIPGISKPALSAALRTLQTYGLITRHQYDELPLRVEYAITDAGIELMKLDYSIVQWEKRYCRFPAPPPEAEPNENTEEQ